jgi:2-keto-4-pentenoate hydratase/2-oxohepta-3-ene-1,7-dioic acid hydratase in catechol pathway
MKIICIGQNYLKHIKELNHQVPDEPVFFMKPDSALLLSGKDFYKPDWSEDLHYEIELVLKINRLGKSIEERFANKYYDEIGLGIDFTARDVQRKLSAKGLPWEKAKAFDSSAVLGDFIPKGELEDPGQINFSLQKNKQIVQQGNSSDMLFSFDKIISHVSQFVTLKIGDLIYTGTPVGVGPVQIGDYLEGYIGEKKVLDCHVK